MYLRAIEEEMAKIMKDHKLSGFRIEEIPRGYSVYVEKNGNNKLYTIFDHNLKNSLNIAAVVRGAFNREAYGWATQKD
jgi:hypothetical protein